METTVVNRYKIAPNWDKDPAYIYIGRRNRCSSGLFGNPIVAGKPCLICDARHEAAGSTLACYEVYLRRRLEYDPKFKAAFLQLDGKYLVCSCAPRRCHGDIIKTVLCELKKLST